MYLSKLQRILTKIVAGWLLIGRTWCTLQTYSQTKAVCNSSASKAAVALDRVRNKGFQRVVWV